MTEYGVRDHVVFRVGFWVRDRVWLTPPYHGRVQGHVVGRVGVRVDSQVWSRARPLREPLLATLMEETEL